MAILRAHHAAISTPDFERAVAFYAAAFDFVEVRRWHWDAVDAVDTLIGLEGSAADAVLMARPDLHLEIFAYRSPIPAAQPLDRPVSDHGITHLCFDVSDLDAEVRRLGELGMTFWAAPVPTGGGVRIVYGRDPDGNVIELREPPAGESPAA